MKTAAWWLADSVIRGIDAPEDALIPFIRAIHRAGQERMRERVAINTAGRIGKISYEQTIKDIRALEIEDIP